MADTTKKPTGIKITRDGYKLKVSWKIADKDYGDGQQMKYERFKATTKTTTDKNGKKKKVNVSKSLGDTDVSIGKTATSKTITLNASDYYPTSKKPKLDKITVKIRGNRDSYQTKNKSNKTVTVNPGWSRWATKDFDISPPKAPAVTQTLSGTYQNVATFSWKVTKTDNAPFVNMQWQSCLVKGNKEPNWDKYKTAYVSHESGTSSSSESSKSFTENTNLWTGNYSYSRWFRIRARGFGGASDWVVKHHTYAAAPTAKNIKASYKKNSASKFTIEVSWAADATKAHPIDEVHVLYAVDVPINKKLSGPQGGDSAFTQYGNAIKDTQKLDRLTFTVNGRLETDQCVWVRIDTVHDGKTTSSNPVLCDGGVARLAAPSGLNVTSSDPETRMVTLASGLTNNSSVPGSFLGIYYKTSTKQEGGLIGIVDATHTSLTFKVPEWDSETESLTIGVRAYVADVSSYTENGVTYYEVTNILMQSKQITDGGSVPVAPTNVNPVMFNSSTIQVTWDWTWSEATGAEVSWADHDDAWYSTDEPQTYTITNIHIAKLNISGLSAGNYYVRVRLFKETEAGTTYGSYSELMPCTLLASPATPHLEVSANTVAADGVVKCTWAYTSGDGTNQVAAELHEVTLDANGAVSSYDDTILASTSTAYHIDLDVGSEDIGWTEGQTHYIALKLWSASGADSEWSNVQQINVAEKPVCSFGIFTNGLGKRTVVVDSGNNETESDTYIVTLPLTFTVNGADEGSMIYVIIERDGSYPIDRPDGKRLDGYDGETIYLASKSGTDNSFEINKNDLISGARLDDGASYKIIAYVVDSYNQKSEETVLNYTIHWDHQALMPSGTVEIDDVRNVAYITPSYESVSSETVLEEGGSDVLDESGSTVLMESNVALNTDVCDIYRLSADGAELIVEGGTFGTKYVDPYPTIGNFGGHRIVFRTANGDYITEDDRLAMEDYDAYNGGDLIDLFAVIIDFDDNQVILPYNIDVSNTWTKDFTEVKYLGGSVEGYWNAGISRTASINTATIVAEDPDTITLMRQLATYPGICRVRMPDGSNFDADVQVTENRENKWVSKVATFSLNITRIDSTGIYGGEEYNTWIITQ